MSVSVREKKAHIHDFDWMKLHVLKWAGATQFDVYRGNGGGAFVRNKRICTHIFTSSRVGDGSGGCFFSPEVRSEAPFTSVGMEIIAITSEREKEKEHSQPSLTPHTHKLRTNERARAQYNVFVGLSYRRNNTLILHLKNGKRKKYEK